MADVCEMRDGSGWIEVLIEEAPGRPGEDKRCVACHGQAKAFRAYSTGTQAHYEHTMMHLGCPEKRSFSGKPSRHSQPLI